MSIDLIKIQLKFYTYPLADGGRSITVDRVNNKTVVCTSTDYRTFSTASRMEILGRVKE